MTDKMIVDGAHRLGELAPAMKDADQALLPDFGGMSMPLSHLRLSCVVVGHGKT